MINQDQSIPCPECKTQIPFDTRQLLMGAQFACPNCNIRISLADESKPIVEKTMEKFDELKRKITKPN
jgi:transcription initiation factor IIE alpha subunit